MMCSVQRVALGKGRYAGHSTGIPVLQCSVLHLAALLYTTVLGKGKVGAARGLSVGRSGGMIRMIHEMLRTTNSLNRGRVMRGASGALPSWVCNPGSRGIRIGWLHNWSCSLMVADTLRLACGVSGVWRM